ncbi:hypothetical protein CKO38_10380 [Rhodospirillum rubrum]|uniref:YaiI/YqxD family protein n=1 Tax=Rhodospirillum rubrum TaxID=1085 RepID=UPI001903ED4D|nr:YaiI/YqxD family protein [Rhodospirillum rubrum]MBK1665191.1 hypothetical protein [Rhodospirillum rubrum]MBK1677065.1 hypothetical protein [Rhodospirillum rubrum]
MEVFIDADACPVRTEVFKVAERHRLIVHVVGNAPVPVPHNDPRVRRVIVPTTPDAADDWIAEHIAEGDICITADIPLAARCLKKGAKAIGTTGKAFTEDSIGMALSMRDLMRDLREAGAVSGGPASFAPKDRSRFLQALEEAIQAVKRGR